jgi:Arc/MetJ-type ribon-helix-helix transcriptional regulator
MNNTEPHVEVLETKKRETTILGTRVTQEFLQLIDEAIAASEGKYATRPDLVRDAIELYARHIKEGGLKRIKQEEDETPSAEDQEYEASVEALVGMVHDFQDSLEDIGFEDIGELAEEFSKEVKQKNLLRPITLWSDDRVRKAMRIALREEVYPKSLWDEARKFRKRRAKDWVEALRKSLRISTAQAQELVLDPDFKGAEYQEWI